MNIEKLPILDMNEFYESAEMPSWFRRLDTATVQLQSAQEAVSAYIEATGHSKALDVAQALSKCIETMIELANLEELS